MPAVHSYVPADWSVDRATGNIRYIGDDHNGANPSYATLIEAHRAWQDLADDAESTGNDEIAIYDENPSGRDTDNIIRLLGLYNVTNHESEHLYDGTLTQDGGNDRWDGIKNFGNADVQIQIHQNGAVLADDWWNEAGAGLNPDLAQGVSHRFMLPTSVGGVDIDGRRLLGTARRFAYTYSEFPINGTAEGNNVLALKDALDLNNETIEATVAAWTGITNTTEGYIAIDVDNDTVDEFYYSEWNTNQPTRSINNFFERMKWLTRDGSISTLYGINGELFRVITHEIDVDTPTGTFNAVEPVSWGTGVTAGTGQMFAINSPTAATKMWIQLLTGVVPTDGETITGDTSTATVDMNVTILARPVSTPFNGVSTGTAMIGSYGFGVEKADLTKNDKVFDLNNDPVTPPNLVTYAVGGAVIGEDRLLVGPWDGVTLDNEGFPAIEVDQMTLLTTLSGATETAVVMTAAIPTDTPESGFIRIELDSGNYKIQPYLSYTGSTFTIASTSFAGDNATNPKNVWIAYLDLLATATTETFQMVYLADRDFVVVARDGGVSPIKEFKAAGQATDTGGSITVIRTSDE